tara:strand:+ start:7181 stop:8782 length:1602 start_codon:yes stop_codon:yes gene_type:complete
MYRTTLLVFAAAFACWGQVLAAVDYDQQHITIAITQEPPNLDSSRTTDLVSFRILGHVNEGLVRYDRRGRIAPGVASSWQVTDDGITYKLRRNAKWSDGSPVVADDFVYAWQLLVDPGRASPYAAIAIPFENAAAISRGEKPVEALGIEAISDDELRVRFETGCGYCVALMTHAAFFPIRRTFHRSQGDRYASEADTILYNGAFVLSEWTHGARLVLDRNPDYWDAASISLNRIDIAYVTEDNRARLNLFRDEAIAYTSLGTDTVGDALDHGLRMRTFASGGLSYLWFNHREGRPTAHSDLRFAIANAFSVEDYVNRVIGIPGYKPAYSFFPAWVEGAEGKFSEEHPVQERPRNVDLANKHLRDFFEHHPAAKDTSLVLLTVSSPTGVRVAEFFQGVISETLGIRVRIDQQTFKQYLVKSRNGDFDIALSSWYPDFDDIVTYADLLGSYNANNRGRWQDEEYDRQLAILIREPVRKKRMASAGVLQQLITEHLPVLPLAETGSAWVAHPQLKGVTRRVMGPDPDFTYARVSPP